MPRDADAEMLEYRSASVAVLVPPMAWAVVTVWSARIIRLLQAPPI